MLAKFLHARNVLQPSRNRRINYILNSSRYTVHFELERYEFENGGKNETSGLEENFMSFEKESEMMRIVFRLAIQIT